MNGFLTQTMSTNEDAYDYVNELDEHGDQTPLLLYIWGSLRALVGDTMRRITSRIPWGSLRAYVGNTMRRIMFKIPGVWTVGVPFIAISYIFLRVWKRAPCTKCSDLQMEVDVLSKKIDSLMKFRQENDMLKNKIDDF
ncbi:uncharacterized protein LOC127860720 isoform X4 [Dreissena polymorpha]|uniref:uncharacterized protein LOC127860720 isoform X4 n=1 Tax=Dreissena polymorpha TaxID=45954 RepID=UPI00226558BE|nr:uncharacterized protein LOC127860720 isoform X4 [Dreissena polymorpha]